MTVLDRINAYTAHRMGIMTKEERDARLADDNWPKHPDGTNMTVGEMSQEDRERIVRQASERSKAKVAIPKTREAEWSRFIERLTGDGTLGKSVQIDRRESSND